MTRSRPDIALFLTGEATERQLTGILFVRGEQPCSLHLRSGALIAIESWDPRGSFAAFLYTTGAIEPDHYRAIRTAQAETTRPLIDLAIARGAVEHAAAHRLYEAYALITLLRLFAEKPSFTFTEGPVAVDPSLIASFSPERFSGTLAALFRAERTRPLLALWDAEVRALHQRAGIDDGPVAERFPAAKERLIPYLERIEKAADERTIRLSRRTGMATMQTVIAIFFCALILAAMLLFTLSENAAQRYAREDALQEGERARTTVAAMVETMGNMMRAR